MRKTSIVLRDLSSVEKSCKLALHLASSGSDKTLATLSPTLGLMSQRRASLERRSPNTIK